MAPQDALDDEVADSIARCAQALGDADRLRDELHVLRLSSDPRAQFATSLFDLERARRGDQQARASMLEVADALLVFWREGRGDELARAHPVLGQLWASAASLLASFEAKRFERALAACWDARADPARLSLAIDDLLPEGNRRVEFARCLYHLELARLFVQQSRAEFAKRVALLSEAYQDPAVAQQLVGADEGLRYLWAEVLPYLDEFFEHLEEQAARRAAAAARAEADAQLPTGHSREVPSFRTLTREPATPSARAGWSDDSTPPELPLAPPAPPPDTLDDDEVVDAVLDEGPPPSPAFSPPGTRYLPPRAPTGELELIEAVEEVQPPPPPPPAFTPSHGSPITGTLELDVEDLEEAPDQATTAFWDHTFATLGLVPEGEQGRSERLLSCESRGERKRLVEFLDTLSPHLQVGEARAFACLVRLMLAGQTREKSLFGQPNPRRVEALAAALPFLGTSPTSAAHAAVWFELDGPETEAALGRGLELLQRYLAYCLRRGRDPLAARTMAAFSAGA